MFMLNNTIISLNGVKYVLLVELLKKNTDLSKTQIKRLISGGGIKVNQTVLFARPSAPNQ